MPATITAQIDPSDDRYHPVITDEAGPIQISVGFDTAGEAIDFGIQVRDQYEARLSHHSPTEKVTIGGGPVGMTARNLARTQ